MRLINFLNHCHHAVVSDTPGDPSASPSAGHVPRLVPFREIRCLFLRTRQEQPPPPAVAARGGENNGVSSDNSCIADELALLMDL